MNRFSFWAVAAFAMITSTSALACPGGMMGGQHGGHGMHAMMHGQGQGMGMNHGQMMGQGCGQGDGGGYCPMSGAAEQTSSAPSSDANNAHAGHEPGVRK